MALKTEGGLKDYRIEFDRETTQGTTDNDPSWQLYSNTIRSFEWSPDGSVEQTLGIGNVDPTAFLKGPESHELTISYDLMRGLVDGSGNPVDPSADGLLRDTDNGPVNTHSFVARENKTGITAEETVNGSTSKDTRIYTVGTGGVVDNVTYTGDPGSQNPVLVDITYQFEKVRSYQIDQPGTSDSLDLVSSDASDTMDVIIEQEDLVSEQVTLNGTNPVTTSKSDWSDIDAIYVVSTGVSTPTDHAGNITISETTSGDDLAIIYGSDAYDGMEGDYGVPVTESGSHPSALPSSGQELIIGDTVTRNGTAAEMAFDLVSVEISVDNNVETTTRIDTVAQRYHMGTRTLELTANVLGESQSHDNVIEHLQVTESDIVWNLTGTTITLENAALTSVGSRSIEAGQAVLQLDNTFTARGLTVVDV